MNGGGGRSDRDLSGGDGSDGSRGNGSDGLLGLGTAAITPTSLRDIRAVAGFRASLVFAIPYQTSWARMASDTVIVADEVTLAVAIRLRSEGHLFPRRLSLVVADAFVTFV